MHYSMKLVLQPGSIDKLLTFDVGLIPVCSPNACKGVFNPNVTIFQSNCAEGLHFSAFHYLVIDFSSNGAWNMHNYKEVSRQW